MNGNGHGEAPASGHEVLTKLKEYDGKTIGSEVMKEIIGAKTSGGVGPMLYHMRNRGIPLDKVLQERVDERGIKFWAVQFP